MMKIVGITGASSGIGAALAELLAGRGHGVALVARSEDKLRDVAARCGEHALVAPADVTDRDQVRAAVQATIDGFGRVDVWVNNAGQGITRPPTALTGGDVDEMIRVNVKSVLYGMQEVLPHFQERGEGQIVNVSSMLGRLPFAVIRSAYVGSKHFMNALTALMRQELSETHPGIMISLVSPGIVHTDFGLNARHGGPDSRSFGGGQSAEEVAEVIADVIERPRPDVYTAKGAQGRVAGYYAALGEDPA